MKQFVLPENAENGRMRLIEKDFHYLIRVRRYSVGDQIQGISPEGRLFSITFEEIGCSWCDVSLAELDRESDFRTHHDYPHIILIPGITKGRKMDLTVRQAVEAGAKEVRPVLTDYSQVHYRNSNDSETKRERWQRIATEALQQCGGSWATKVNLPAKLTEAIRDQPVRGQVFFLHEKILDTNNNQSSNLFRRLAEPPEEIAIIVGPEGGLSPRETEFLMEHHAEPLYLGNRVLRAETAALYGLAAVATIIRERAKWHPA